MIMRYRDNGNIEFLYHCHACGKENSLELNSKYKDAIDKWESGESIQKTGLMELSPSTREILISQICPDCQDEIFLDLYEQSEGNSNDEDYFSYY